MIRCLMGVWIAVLLTITGCASSPPIDVMREKGDWHFKYGRYEQAAEQYGGIIAKAPGDWQAQSRYGQSMQKMGDLDAARRALEVAYAKNPLDNETAHGLAEVMYTQGDHQRLYQFLKDRAASQRTVGAYLDMADYCREMGDFDSAMFAAETAILIDNGQTAEPYLKASELAGELGRPEEALIRLRQAYGVNPAHQGVLALIKQQGEIAGPTFALPPGKDIAALDPYRH